MAHRGRPKDEAREIAAMVGDRFYEGSACSICSNRVRYTAGGACVTCGVRRNAAYRDKTAPERKRHLLNVADHAIAAADAIENFTEALRADHDLLEVTPDPKQPWD